MSRAAGTSSGSSVSNVQSCRDFFWQLCLKCPELQGLFLAALSQMSRVAGTSSGSSVLNVQSCWDFLWQLCLKCP